MAITTFDGASSGVRPPVAFTKALSGTLVAGRPYSYWAAAGNPGAGAFNATLNGVNVDNTVTGPLSKGNPVSGNGYLYNLAAAASAQGGMLMLCDRLWHNGGYTITSTAAQNITQPTLPARCPTSAVDDTPATTGHGILLGMEISAATGAGTPTITASYTNSAGTAGRTATNAVPTVATSAAGSFYPLGLQAGDAGVRSVQSITLSATWTSGTMNLVAYRPIALLPLVAAGIPGQLDWISGGAARIYDSSALFFIIVPQTTTTTQISGLFIETHG